MTWCALFLRLQRGVAVLRREGPDLVVQARRGTLTPVLLAGLRTHKQDILSVLGDDTLGADEVAERAAIAWAGCLSGAAGTAVLDEYDRLSRPSPFRMTAG